MKPKGSHRDSEHRGARNARVRQEICAFLQALASYPDTAASNPEITFEQHRISLMDAPPSQPRAKRCA